LQFIKQVLLIYGDVLAGDYGDRRPMSSSDTDAVIIFFTFL